MCQDKNEVITNISTYQVKFECDIEIKIETEA